MKSRARSWSGHVERDSPIGLFFQPVRLTGSSVRTVTCARPEEDSLEEGEVNCCDRVNDFESLNPAVTLSSQRRRRAHSNLVLYSMSLGYRQ